MSPQASFKPQFSPYTCYITMVTGAEHLTWSGRVLLQCSESWWLYDCCFTEAAWTFDDDCDAGNTSNTFPPLWLVTRLKTVQQCYCFFSKCYCFLSSSSSDNISDSFCAEQSANTGNTLLCEHAQSQKQRAGLTENVNNHRLTPPAPPGRSHVSGRPIRLQHRR